MSLSLPGLLQSFNMIVDWDGESVEQLRDAILLVRDSGNELLLEYLPHAIDELVQQAGSAGVKLDNLPLIAVDRKGFALYGNIHRLESRPFTPFNGPPSAGRCASFE